jgi:hypothetical protein
MQTVKLLKMAVFLDGAPCSLVDINRLLEELTASIIRVITHNPYSYLSPWESEISQLNYCCVCHRIKFTKAQLKVAWCVRSSLWIKTWEEYLFFSVSPYFYLLFCMGVKLDRSHRGKNADWGCLRTWCLGEYLDLRGMKWQEAGENYIKRSAICLLFTRYFWMIKSRRMRWAWHVACLGRWELRTKFWLESLTGRDHSEDLGFDGKVILKWILGKEEWRAWIGFIWLRIVTGGGLLWTR